MKKILFSMAMVATVMSGCSLDVNDNPNYPTTMDPSFVMPAAQNAIATVVGDGMYNPAGFFTQYYDQLPESQQYADICRYRFIQSSAVLDRSYSRLYAYALEDLEDVLTSNETTGADKFVATALRAYCFQVAVDNWGEVPYTEAFMGGSNPSPRFDEGQAVYEGVLAELDEAEAQIEGSITVTDMVANGNLSQWTGFANALRLRMYLRFIDGGVDAAGYTEKVKSLLAANKFFTGDIKFDNYRDETDRRNPWYSTNYQNLNTTNHCAGYALVSYMEATGDVQRLQYGFVPATATGVITGALPATKYAFSDIKNANVSQLRYYAAKPVYFFTQAELQFLIAEAQLRFNGDDAAAKSAYEAAIEVDFAARGLEGASELYNGTVAWSTASSTTDKLNLIYMQKWVALFYMDHMEAWSELRRTDVPKASSQTAQQIRSNPATYTPGEIISPAVNALGQGQFVKRMWIPYSAAQYNPNAPESKSLTTPVWWDK